MARFETELLASDANIGPLIDMSGVWIDHVHDRRPAEAATSRGIEVTLKEGETKDAAVSRTVRLYEESYALVIGIDNYTGGWPRLSNAVRDARLVAETLRARGFHVDFRKNLRSADFKLALEEFFAIRGENPAARHHEEDDAAGAAVPHVR
jgi:hypothetical protein